MKTLILAAYRNWLRSPSKMGVILAFMLAPIAIGFGAVVSIELFGQVARDAPTMLTYMHTSLPFIAGSIFVLGRGCVASERDSGMLTTIFARPLRRSTYILAKWLALASASFAIGLVVVLELWLVDALGFHLFIDPTGLAIGLLEDALFCLGLSAVVIALSTCLPLYADVTMYIFGLFAASFLSVIAISTPSSLQSLIGDNPMLASVLEQGQAAAGHCAETILQFLWPQVDLSVPELVAKSLVVYLSNLLACLCCASWFINVREISYGGNG